MIIKKNKFFTFALVAILILLNGGKVHAQFSGSLTLSGYRSTNVEGRDSTTPDNTLNPTLDIIYNWTISDPSSIKVEATITPNIYTQVNSRSYTKSFLGVTGNFYLSDIEEDSKQPRLAPIKVSPPQSSKSSEQPKSPPNIDTLAPVVTIKPSSDLGQIASVKLAILSELLDSFDIEKKGLTADSVDAASDLKDSVSEAVIALSDVLATEAFTESITEVVITELTKQKKIFSQVPMEVVHKSEVFKDFDDIKEGLRNGKPQSDILPVPKPSADPETSSASSATSSSQADILPQTLAQIQEESKGTALKENAPLITLVNSQTAFNEFSSQDILLEEDILSLSKKTLATVLTTPITLETQTNKDAYKIYSYSTFELKPRIDYYFSSKAALGFTYDLSSTKFPYDTVYEGSENKMRFDGRFEIAKGVVFSAEAGLGFRSFNHPLQYQVQPTKRIIKTGSSFSHYLLGASVIFFPANRFDIGIAVGITRSSKLRPYLVDLISSRSSIGGSANDDSYSYNLTRGSIFSLWRIVWDINFTLDISYEDRKYADISIPRGIAKRLQLPTGPRSDKGPQFGLNLSREFLFDSRLISIFNSFTPVFDIQSSQYTSTQKTFNYKEITTTLSLEFGF